MGSAERPALKNERLTRRVSSSSMRVGPSSSGREVLTATTLDMTSTGQGLTSRTVIPKTVAPALNVHPY